MLTETGTVFVSMRIPARTGINGGMMKAGMYQGIEIGRIVVDGRPTGSNTKTVTETMTITERLMTEGVIRLTMCALIFV